MIHVPFSRSIAPKKIGTSVNLQIHAWHTGLREFYPALIRPLCAPIPPLAVYPLVQSRDVRNGNSDHCEIHILPMLFQNPYLVQLENDHFPHLFETTRGRIGFTRSTYGQVRVSEAPEAGVKCKLKMDSFTEISYKKSSTAASCCILKTHSSSLFFVVCCAHFNIILFTFFVTQYWGRNDYFSTGRKSMHLFVR